MKVLQKMHWFNFIQFTVGYFNEYEAICNFKQSSWNVAFIGVSIAFIKNALFVDVMPKFGTAKGRIINERDSLTASHNLMKSHLTKHVQYNDLKSLFYSNIGVVLGNILINIAWWCLWKRYLSLKIKNQKIVNLIKHKRNV